MSQRIGIGARPRMAAAVALVVALVAGSCARATSSSTRIMDPAASVTAKPDYTQSCSPSGPDASSACAQVILQAIDNARAKEGVKPMAIPVDFAQLSVPEQLLVAIDAERTDRGLAPFAGLSAELDLSDQAAAAAGKLPADPGKPYTDSDTEWIGSVSNALDADYEWMYGDGPGSVQGCSRSGQSGCWADRHIVLDDFGADAPGETLVLGAAFDPSSDRTPGDLGGTSLAATLAGTTRGDTLVYTWAQARADIAAGRLQPRNALPANASATHIADPPQSVDPSPDYTKVCAPAGVDTSDTCIAAVLAAINAARLAEGVKAMVLPLGFAQLSIPEQIFVAVNLERVDRGLAPFVEMTAPLNANAQIGADEANDPPDPGGDYRVIDTEWAGGSSNGLDADFGWMYDDGIGSGNLDCPKSGGPGCWGHRHGILDDFGTVGTMVMGAAVNTTADTGDDKGGPSMAATLALTSRAVGTVTFTWAQVLAEMASS